MSIEAMQTALDALENLTSAVGHPDNVKIGMEGQAALRTAIEEAKKQEPVAWMGLAQADQVESLAFDKSDLRDYAFIAPLYTVLPVQEPVAWVYEFWADRGYKGLAFEPQKSADNTPLYTTPPAAQWQWVGLTNEEIEKMWDDGLDIHVGISALRAITRTIEAKLKEKNYAS